VTAVPVFSDAWARACAALINANEAYRLAAREWEGPIVLLMSTDAGPGDDQRVFLDLWHGECREARAATIGDEATARYVLAGASEAWRQVLTGRVPPILALMTGRLRLAKGSLLELLPYVAAAKELVAAASAVLAEFPEVL
jgi:putative sterol carrier protein